jgi:hypothetical protein
MMMMRTTGCHDKDGDGGNQEQSGERTEKASSVVFFGLGSGASFALAQHKGCLG